MPGEGTLGSKELEKRGRTILPVSGKLGGEKSNSCHVSIKAIGNEKINRALRRPKYEFDQEDKNQPSQRYMQCSGSFRTEKQCKKNRSSFCSEVPTMEHSLHLVLRSTQWERGPRV